MTAPRQVILSVPAWLRRHWAAAALLAGGLVLRALALAAYHPALLYTDTLKYLYGAWAGADPLGYAGVLKVILAAGDLGTVAVIQHLLGVAMAVAVYAVLLRRGVPRWLSAAAMAPVLLDAYQLRLEQTIMPDVWFEALIVAGLALLLWRPEPSVLVIAGSGLILGVAVTVRQVGLILVLPALLYLAAAITARAHAMRGAVAMIAAFAVPVVAYSAVSYLTAGRFGLSDEGSISGRLAVSADCRVLVLPADERPLCPTRAQQALGIDWIEHSSQSPLKRAPVPAGLSRGALISGFDAAVEQQQPLRVISGILHDSVRLFAPAKTALPGVTPISRWQFQTRYPVYLPEISVGAGHRIILGIQVTTAKPFSYRPLDPAYGGAAQVDRPIAAFLRSYQLGGGYTPGPLLALFALASLAGSVLALAGRRLLAGRRGEEREREVSSLGLACLLFCATAVGLLLISDLYEFSWRYQLPALVTLPPAGVLGGWALWRALARRPRPLRPRPLRPRPLRPRPLRPRPLRPRPLRPRPLRPRPLRPRPLRLPPPP